VITWSGKKARKKEIKDVLNLHKKKKRKAQHTKIYEMQ
jgi:hypothetical protein